MIIKSATFVKSSASVKELPGDNFPEYAFVGRSNVGKSSWINCLCGRKKLAKTSATPGKTQLINHFLINESWYLADLPGYGYAKVSKQKRKGFAKLIADYLILRKNLMNTYVLVDSRHKPQALDLEFMEFLGIEGIPFTILFTKVDKPKQQELRKNVQTYKRVLSEVWEELPPMMYTSADFREGPERGIGADRGGEWKVYQELDENENVKYYFWGFLLVDGKTSPRLDHFLIALLELYLIESYLNLKERFFQMNLPPILENHKKDLISLCHEFKVSKLYAFGSVVSDRFDPISSDLDLWVEMLEMGPLERGDNTSWVMGWIRSFV